MVDDRPPPEREINTMTQGDLDHLRESCSFPSRIQTRPPNGNETIVSARPGEVAFYEVVFHASLHLPIHPTIKRILHFYNICPALPSSPLTCGKVLFAQWYCNNSTSVPYLSTSLESCLAYSKIQNQTWGGFISR